MRSGLIYKLTIGNYFIVGSTINYTDRKSEYNRELRKGDYSNTFLQNVYNKYNKGLDLNFEVLQDNISELILRDVENIWIGSKCAMSTDNKNGLNLQSARGCNKSPETIEKLRIAGLNVVFSEERKEKIRLSKLGLTHSDETKIKMRLAKLGKLQSLNTINKKSKPINQIDLITNKIIATFPSAREAARILGIDHANISKVCNKERKSTNKLVFEYSNK